MLRRVSSPMAPVDDFNSVHTDRRAASPSGGEQARRVDESHPHDGLRPLPESNVWVIPADAVVVGRSHAWLEALYRLFEIACAALALAAATPLIVIVAAWVKLDSRGPVLFSQQRVAQSRTVPATDLPGSAALHVWGQQPAAAQRFLLPATFRFVKFRTMHWDAKERFPVLYRYRYCDRATFLADRFKKEEDPRVTRAGVWLRRWTLDELPNFWCVLTGDMRLVGPRPELPQLLCNYAPHEMAKFAVKPGITGFAQIRGRGNLNFRDTLQHDLEYVAQRSVWLDLRILFVTLWLVLARRGAF